MRGMHRVGDLGYDRRHLVDGKWSLPFGVLLEDLAHRPFDGEKVHSRAGFADLDRSNDIRVLHALAISGFAQEAGDGGSVLAQLLSQNLYGHGAVIGVVRAKDGGGTAFTHFALQ